MNVELAREAKHDLDGVWQYTAEKWGLEQADGYTDSLVSRVKALARTPGLWRPAGLRNPEIHVCSEKRHRIFFRDSGDRIQIVRILHVRQDFMAAFRE